MTNITSSIHEKLWTNAKFLGFDASFDEASVVVFGVPFDGTTSNRPGTRFSTSAMRPESYGLETYSPLLDLDTGDVAIADMGEVSLNLGNTQLVLNQIQAVVADVLSANKKPLMIGGEHLVSLPALKAVYEKYPDVHIIHLDAHTDLADMLSGEKYSHGTFMRRAYEFLGEGRIYQFGLRSGCREEFNIPGVYQEKFDITTTGEIIKQLSGKNVYVTIDVDVLDPSIMPGTGTLEAGGITYRQLEKFFLELKNSDMNIVGADIVELSPPYDNSGSSTATACKILREISLILANK